MSTHEAPLSLLFGSKTRLDLLAWFVMHPGEPFYIRQLAAILGQSPTPVFRELQKLEKLGLVTSETRANAKYFSINEQSPIFPELQSLVLKTVGVGDEIKKGLKNFREILFAFIYGSFAVREAGPQSDIDLLIIGKVPSRELTVTIKKIEMKIKREIQFSIFPPREFQNKIKAKNPFLNEVVNAPKIMLIGSEDEFNRFGKKGLDKAA